MPACGLSEERRFTARLLAVRLLTEPIFFCPPEGKTFHVFSKVFPPPFSEVSSRHDISFCLKNCVALLVRSPVQRPPRIETIDHVGRTCLYKNHRGVIGQTTSRAFSDGNDVRFPTTELFLGPLETDGHWRRDRMPEDRKLIP